jgi:hypothetical protein
MISSEEQDRTPDGDPIDTYTLWLRFPEGETAISADATAANAALRRLADSMNAAARRRLARRVEDDRMTDLAEFLLARIAEDEQAAEATRASFGDEGCYECSLGRPLRVLADCEAKRRILELHKSGDAWCDHCSGWYGPDPAADCPTLRLLALPYADHPDFREGWRL